MLEFKIKLSSAIAILILLTVVTGVCHGTPLFHLEKDFKKMPMEPFYHGYYGKDGGATYFVSTKKSIPDDTRLYWAIVHVLSKKYGCLLLKKKRRDHYTSFLCRDGRIVVFKHRWHQRYVVFSGRQFDRKGRELVVRGKRVVRRIPLFDNL